MSWEKQRIFWKNPVGARVRVIGTQQVSMYIKYIQYAYNLTVNPSLQKDSLTKQSSSCLCLHVALTKEQHFALLSIFSPTQPNLHRQHHWSFLHCIIGNYSSPQHGKISIFLLCLVINTSSTLPTPLSHEDAQTFFEYGAICTLLFPRPLRRSWREFWAEESGKIHPCLLFIMKLSSRLSFSNMCFPLDDLQACQNRYRM